MPKKIPALQLVSAGGEATSTLSPMTHVPHQPATLLPGAGATRAATPIAYLPPASGTLSSDGEALKCTSPNEALPRTSDALINAIREAHRRRDALMRAEGSLTRQIRAQCRRATGASPDDEPKEAKRKEREAAEAYTAVCAGQLDGLAAIVAPIVMGLLAGREVIEREHRDAVKHLERLAKQAHVAQFVAETRGFGFVGLGQIIGEAGDLSAYSNPAKLWKRFGLGLISSGERQRKFADAAKAIEAGYSPRRRSLMFVLGDSLLKQQGPYRELYLARKAYEEQKAPTLTKMAWHRRAQRYMEKRLLRDLWRAWTGLALEWKEAA